ncbi:MAG: 50S ribosomal protein L24 [Candidatus Levybacteria bacterium]|nr:50S ribosomal protein L24 [Candidatus Levybacteria bacterium]
MKKSSKFKVKSSKLQKGDEVKIVRGRDKGKTGKINKVFPRVSKVLVPGVNEFKRHSKARTQSQKSEIITIVKPLPIASVALICPKCHEPTRVGFSMLEGKKTRICKKCQQTL